MKVSRGLEIDAAVAEIAGCRVGIDVGGTFTDFVLVDGETGALSLFKEPSVPEDPSLSVERGLSKLLERAGKKPSDVGLIVHGTTIGVNAIIQRRGAKMGLVVSRGMRGVLEIGRSQLPNAFSFALQKEEPLVPRRLVMETGVRILQSGTLFSEPEPGEIEAIAARFNAAGVDAVTILLLHSYRRPDVEEAIAENLRRHLPGVSITCSAGIWPEQREFERGLVALMNAYVQPILENYFDRLQERVSGLGVAAPIYITANNGGTLSLPTARSRPIDTLLSGPASGVVAAAVIAKAVGAKNIITVDMGGTSADMSVVRDGRPESTNRTTIGDFPIIVPVVNVSAIGAGGGSIVWVDPHGVLKIGPRSAGASPGPVCYGRGGKEPTVTDCYLLAGFIDPDRFLGGRMPLDISAARAALDEIGAKMGFDGDERAVKAAEAALRVTTAMMAAEMAKYIAQRGDDLKEYSLLPFGGAGPTQANLLAEGSGITSFIVPKAPGTFCALGAILADVKRDYVRSHHFDMTNDPNAPKALESLIGELAHDASEWISAEGDILIGHSFEAMLDMRYGGQAFDLQVTLPPIQDEPFVAAEIIELFHRVHEKVYQFRDAEASVEITTVRLRVTGKVPPVDLSKEGAPKILGQSMPELRRKLYWRGTYYNAVVLDRFQLPGGSTILGPAIVEQEDTTTVILPNWQGTVDAFGNLIVTSRQ